MQHRIRRLAASLFALIAVALAVPLPACTEPTAGTEAQNGADAVLMQQIDEAARRAHEYVHERQRTTESEFEERARRERERVRREGAERAEQSAAERTVRERIAEQEAMQSDLLRAVERKGVPARPRLGGANSESRRADLHELDPRTASPAPQPRVLPEEIFDSRPVEVAPGRWGNEHALSLIERVLDADSDGKPELVRWSDPQTGRLVRQQRDRDYDGVADEWSRYDTRGDLVSRVLDDDDDGTPDVFERYHEGLLEAREIDRDGDGVKDAFYRYHGEGLMEERHDANNDGRVDLVITYAHGARVRAEEDLDRDGRMDSWTRYRGDPGSERVARIEIDRSGRGFADRFEFFEGDERGSHLVRREEDSDGDGETDIVSFYERGKLRRRQIARSAADSL